MVVLSLSIESDGRQIAQRLRADGVENVAVLRSDVPLQARFANAFVSEWLLQGGGPPLALHFEAAPEMLALVRRELARHAVDAIVLALDADDALTVRPYLGQIPIYTSREIDDRQAAAARRDLEGVRFVELPWLADPSRRIFYDFRRIELPNASF